MINRIYVWCERVRLCSLVLLAVALISPYAFAGGEEQRREAESRRAPASHDIGGPAEPSASQPDSPAAPPLPEVLEASRDPGITTTIREIVVLGKPDDVATFYALRSVATPELTVASRLQDQTVGRELNAEDIRVIAVTITIEELVGQGYLLAYLAPDYPVDDDGLLTFQVSLGRFGMISHDPDGSFRGRYFSRRQIDRHWRVTTGDIFDYHRFYDDAYTLNRTEDLTVDTRMKVRTDDETGDRIADIALRPRESLPLHASLEAGNYGTEQSGHERLGVNLAYGNITRHNDTLHASYTMGGGDPDDYQSVYGNYTLPFDFRERFSISVFGGRSDTETSNVAPGLDIAGEEEFSGLQATYRLFDDRSRTLEAIIGRTWRRTTNRTELNGESIRDVGLRVAPFDVGLYYRDKETDNLNGRSALGLTFVTNLRGLDGTSSDSGSNAFDASLDMNYRVWRGYVTRYQSLSKRGAAVWLRINGQYSEDHLPASEQKSAGGIYNVRGYEEDVFLNDKGIDLSLECHAPRIEYAPATSWFGRPCVLSGYGLVFFDYAYARDNHSTFGNDRFRDDLRSAGVGVRVSVNQNLSLRFDYGWPIADVDGSNASGRAHIATACAF